MALYVTRPRRDEVRIGRGLPSERKYIDEIKKKFFSRTAEPIATKFGTKHPWVKGIKVCSNEEPFNSHKVNNGFFLFLINIMIIICVY